MKKIVALLLLISFGFTSCGPRRYKCGPNRRCEIKENTIPKKIIPENYTVKS